MRLILTDMTERKQIEEALSLANRKLNLLASVTRSEIGLLIVCEDDGAGISPEDKPHLFTRGFGKHTGLGLFLCREILSITGITIRENSEPGKGARFEMLVPVGTYRFITG